MLNSPHLIYDVFAQINGVDVTSRTHYDCVKLIKKTGDTLALKVLTVNHRSNAAAFANSANLASTSTTPSGLASMYQSPLSLINENNASTTSTMSRTPATSSQSYYATTTISSGTMDGTKSLPNKKKRKCL